MKRGDQRAHEVTKHYASWTGSKELINHVLDSHDNMDKFLSNCNALASPVSTRFRPRIPGTTVRIWIAAVSHISGSDELYRIHSHSGRDFQ